MSQTKCANAERSDTQNTCFLPKTPPLSKMWTVVEIPPLKYQSFEADRRD